MVLSAKASDDDSTLKALQGLAMAYWHPIYAYLLGRGLGFDDAKDATQGFFAYLLARDFLSNIEPEGGRFRNFLLVALRRWMKDERKRAINVKRDAEIEWHPWHDQEMGNHSSHLAATTPEDAFDRSWAEALVTQAMLVLQERWENRPALFEALRLMVESPGNVEKYAAIAERLEMSEGAVGKAAHDLRRQFAEQIRLVVRDTVARDEDVEEELRYLIGLMRT